MNIGIIANCFPKSKQDYIGLFLLDIPARFPNDNVRVLTLDRGIQEDVGVPVDLIRWPRGNAINLSSLNKYTPIDWLRVAWLFFSGRRQVVKWAKQNSIERILAVWMLPSGFFAYCVKRKLGIPYDVWSLGGDMWSIGNLPLVKTFSTAVVKNANNVFADGELLAKQVSERFNAQCGIVRLKRKLDLTIHAKTWIDGKYHIAFVARYERVKGIDILLEAMKHVTKDVVLHVYGAGSLESWMKQYVADNNLFDVEINGIIDTENLVSLLKGAQCLVIPSRDESVPVIMVDAAMCSCPVLVSDVGDMGKLVRESKAGEIFNPGDPIELARVINLFVETNGRANYVEQTKKLAEVFT